MADESTAVLVDAVETVITRALAPVVTKLRELESSTAAVQASIIDAAANVIDNERRIAALETREPAPGPPGPPGPAGPAGADGIPGMTYRGVWAPGDYRRGDVVTRDGSMWHCNADTATRPGDGGPAWTLAVKRGRDGGRP